MVIAAVLVTVVSVMDFAVRVTLSDVVTLVGGV
jgi:hypothetical protein